MTTSNYLQADDSTTSDITYTFIGIPQVGCPYEHKCTDYGKRCDSCRYGRRSYYEPEEPDEPIKPDYVPYYPWYPYEPYYPWYPYYPYLPYPYHPWEITWYTTTTSGDTGDDLTMPTVSCYTTRWDYNTMTGDAIFKPSLTYYATI